MAFGHILAVFHIAEAIVILITYQAHIWYRWENTPKVNSGGIADHPTGLHLAVQ